MTDEEIADANPNMRPKDLYQAYLIAGERNDLQHFKDILVAHKENKAIEEAAKEAAKAAKEAKKTKKPRVSTTKVIEEDEDVEMADAVAEPESEGAEAPTSAKPKTKKRKNPDGETEVRIAYYILEYLLILCPRPQRNPSLSKNHDQQSS
jgi:hypothetical protein